MPEKKVILEVKNLKKYFNIGNDQVLKAVDDVSFEVYKGETLGLVGESGCGKSTLGRTILRLYDATDGTIKYDGEKINGKLPASTVKSFNRKMQMIFQDPYASLNQRMRVENIVAEGIDNHGLAKNTDERYNKVVEMLETVGLNEEHAKRYPHEFSGGQRQRIGIARALAIDPEFIIADEPISALDVSIQAQIVNLLKELQVKRGLTYLFIAHDLSMVKHISDRLGVMYLGHLMELSASDRIFENPLHPYTKALLSAIPLPDPKLEREKQQIILDGHLPSPVNPPSGCTFRTRCNCVKEVCSQKAPEWKEIEPEHFVACHNF